MAELKELCEELDRTLLELMDGLKGLSSLRNKYRDVVKEGYFAMSQARHAMGGPMCVSRVQYDAGMKSLAQVNLETNLSMADASISSYDDLSSSKVKDKVHVEFKVQRIKPGAVCRSKPLAEDEGVLRRRKGEEGIEEVTTEGGDEVCREVKDPIRWFGVLVPQNLRRCQQCFVQAVNHCAELASVQMRVELACRHYQELLGKKKELTGQSRQA